MYCQNMFGKILHQMKVLLWLFCYCYQDLLDQYYSNSVFICWFHQVDAIVNFNFFIWKLDMAFCNKSLHNSLETFSSSITLQSKSIQSESTNLTYYHVFMHSTRREGSYLSGGSCLWLLAAPYMQ